MRLRLGYGARPIDVEVPSGAEVIEAATPPPAVELEAALRDALDAPIGSAPLEELARGASRVLIVVSDATRDDPRAALIAAVRERLPATAQVTLAIATGTHGPADLTTLDGVDASDLVVNHDGRAADDMVDLGRSRRGTPFRVHRAVVDSDLVVATGVLRPHYFAGWGAGCKAIFPGLGASDAVRVNHELKAEAGSRAGCVDGNPCRDDLEDIVDKLPVATFLLNVVVDSGGGCQGAVAGDLRAAFRAGAAAADPLFRVRVPRADCIVVSDDGPVTTSLYQASKLVAAVAERLRDGGTIVVAAECAAGLGPIDVVNRGIFEIGIRPRLPARHRVVLVSGLAASVVARSYCESAPSVEAAIAAAPGELVVLPHAGRVIASPA